MPFAGVLLLQEPLLGAFDSMSQLPRGRLFITRSEGVSGGKNLVPMTGFLEELAAGQAGNEFRGVPLQEVAVHIRNNFGYDFTNHRESLPCLVPACADPSTPLGV